MFSRFPALFTATIAALVVVVAAAPSSPAGAGSLDARYCIKGVRSFFVCRRPPFHLTLRAPARPVNCCLTAVASVPNDMFIESSPVTDQKSFVSLVITRKFVNLMGVHDRF